MGFLNFRDQESGRKGKKGDDEMDSDDDDNDNPILGKADDEEDKEDNKFLSPDDIKRQGELEEGVRKIRVSTIPRYYLKKETLTISQLKRQHSAEPGSSNAENSASTPASGTTPPAAERSITPPKTTTDTETPEKTQPSTDAVDGFLGSPLKKQRASVSTADENALRRRIAESSGRINEVLGTGTTENKTASTGSFGDKLDQAPAGSDNIDEEL